MEVQGLAILNKYVSTGLIEVVTPGQRFKRGKEASHTISKSEEWEGPEDVRNSKSRWIDEQEGM